MRMVMVDGRNLTSQEAFFYNQGASGKAIAIQHYNQRVYGSQTAPQEKQPTAPQPTAKRTITLAPQVAERLQKTSVGRTVLASPYVTIAQPRTPTPTTLDLQKLQAEPRPLPGTYQAKPGGELLVSTDEQNARLLAEKQIKMSPYKQQYGYTPPDRGYTAEIQNIGNELNEQRTYLQQIKSASEGTTFTIDNKQYSRQDAINYINKSISELTQSKAYLERYKEAGYIISKTDEGYSFSLPKASEIVRKIYGREPTETYIVRELGTGFLGLSMLGAIAGQAITGKPAIEEHYEEQAQSLLSITRRPGESGEAYTARFWNPIETPEVAMNVYVSVITLGGSKLLTEVGKVFAPEIIGIGSKMTGITAKASALAEKLPSSIKYVGALAKTPVGSQVLKYGFYGAMEAPVLIETAQTQPELLGARIFQSLGQYEMFTGELEAGGRILKKGIAEMRQPVYMTQRPIAERLGLRTMGEEATQPVPGLRMKGRLQEMTARDIEQADIALARGYKEPKPRGLSPEESELESLSQSMRKRPGFKEFLKSEEGTQPLPGARRLISSKGMTEAEIQKADEMLARGYKEAKPRGLSPEDTELQSLSESFNKSFGAKKEITPSIRPKEETITIPKEYVSKYESKYETFGISKKPGLKEFIKSEEAMQPVPGARAFLKSEETTEPLPGVRLKERTPTPSQELFFTESTGRVSTIEAYEPFPKAQVLTEKTPSGIATSIEEFPRKGLLEMGEGVRTAEPFSLPASYEKEVTQLGAGKRRLDLIEAKLGKPTGKLIAEETKKGALTIAEFAPGERMEFQGLMGVRRVTPVSKIGLGKQEPSLMESGIIPETKETAKKISEGMNKPYELSLRPKGGLWEEEIQSYYVAPPKPTSRGEPVGIIKETDIFGYEIKQAKKLDTFDIGREGMGIKSTVLEQRAPGEIPGFKKTPLRYERPKVAEETKPVTSGDLELISVTKKEKGFQPSGLYESPEMEYMTVERPLTRQEVRLLSTVEDTGRMSVRWEETRPRMEKAKQYEAGGLIDTVREPGQRLQFTSALEGRAFGSPLMDIQGLGIGTISERERKQKEGLLLSSLSRQDYDELLGIRQAQDVLQEQMNVSLQERLQEQLQETEQKQELKTKPLLDLFTDTITTTPVKPTIPDMITPFEPRIKIPRRKQQEPSEEYISSKEKREGKGYDVYVKERSMYKGEIRKPTKFTKMNRSPLSYRDALSLGGDITDNTSAVSFRIKKTKEKPSKPDRPVQDFGIRSHKFTKRGETFIEKPDYRMDTPGELQQVSALGHEARREEGKRLNIYTHHKRNSSELYPVKTPHNRSTGLLSRTTKIRETGLFKKKKKGERKNAYY